MPGEKLGVISLGCAKNLVDTEVMLGLITEAGFEVTNNAQEAQVLIINTCGFINDAKEESIDTILEMAEYKNKGNCKVLLATGCLTQRYREELMKEIPELDGIIGTGDYNKIATVIEDALKGTKIASFDNCGFLYDHTYPRLLSGPSHRAYVKIAEGCNHKCAFCVIPDLRGRYQSRSPESVIKEVEGLANRGVKEINLIAQDSTSYGKDLKDSSVNLARLLKQLVNKESVEWLRVLYGYPTGVTEDLIEVIANENKICKYLDIPLQHAHPEILKKMGRFLPPEDAKQLITKIRKNIPGVILRSTFMVGFPGEKDHHFDELYQFMQEIQFERAGVFVYSREESTKAAKLKEQVKNNVKVERFHRLMKLQKKISEQKNKDYLGSIQQVLVEGQVRDSHDLYFGRFWGQAPEVDGLVYFTSNRHVSSGDLVKAKITGTYTYDLKGEVI